MTPRRATAALVLLAIWVLGCSRAPGERYDVVLRGGTVFDGTGTAPRVADVGLRGDRIATIGDLARSTAAVDLDVRGLAVAPGFINMLSWATDSLILDGRSESEIRQGVTLEVFGEGTSYGPVNDRVRAFLTEQLPAEFHYEVTWGTLGEYLEHLESRGVSTNVASFVGATTLRIHVVGFDDRPPTATELDQMRSLARAAMEQGALGVGSSLIYAPAFYARTDELIELARISAAYDGMYISHLRSEGDRLLEGVEELISIARASGVRAEIYHLKAAGQANWPKLDAAIEAIERARAEGLAITADMYTYTAGATGLDAAMPPWVQEGGFAAWSARLRDPAVRARVAAEMGAPGKGWENLYHAASPQGMLLVSFRNPALRGLRGRTLADVARERGKTPAETAMDLVAEDGSRVGTVYFMMSEDNVRREIRLPWVSFGSDEASQAPVPPFLEFTPHPRAYGNFARLLGPYVRDEQLIPLEEAIRRLTSLPASNLKLRDRGTLAPGAMADVVVFDPATIADRATYEEPHQFATGVRHVFVNGVVVLKDGEHTGATPGRVVRGPGWTGWR